MARRASYIDALREHVDTTPPFLLIAGGYELVPYAGDTPPMEKMRAETAVYDSCGYDYGYLTEMEATQYVSLGIAPPKAWKPYSRLRPEVFERGGKRIAVIALPPLPSGYSRVPDDQLPLIEAALRSAHEAFDLVIAVSPWGFFAEKDFLGKAETVPHVLLGSGPGTSFPGNIAADGRTAWVRPYSRGKAISRVTLNVWPKKGLDFKWVAGDHIAFAVDGLSDTYQEKPAVLNLLEGIQE